MTAMVERPVSPIRRRLDRAGIVLSGLCAVHCVVSIVIVAGVGAGLGIGDMITDGIKSLAPTAALLFFAIIFFGIMIDVGLFDPLVRGILRVVRNDPMKLVVGTAVLAMVVSLDGDGSTTFIIVTSALPRT